MSLYADKVAIVTGARRGVGRHIAEHFLREGAHVIGLARRESTIANEKYTHLVVDVSSGEQVQKTFHEISRQFPAVHILVNNAGVFTSQYSMILPARRAQEMVETNILGTFYVSREALKVMRKGKYGRIINIGSVAPRMEPLGSSIYAATKAAVMTMSNVMAKEFSSFKVTCNTVGVTFIETDMLQQFPPDQIEALVKSLPIPRFATAEDVCHVVDFFASEKSGYITAQTVFLGGIH
jgi:3-oxoacyl-[acyl-carrier protein] reductase